MCIMSSCTRCSIWAFVVLENAKAFSHPLSAACHPWWCCKTRIQNEEATAMRLTCETSIGVPNSPKASWASLSHAPWSFK